MDSTGSALVFRHPARSIRRAPLRAFLCELQERIAHGAAIVCLMTDDAELYALNKRFRRKDSATDVLSFPSVPANGALGELAISIDRARAQAAEHGHSLHDELRILMLHGALHLAGFDHERDGGEMARAEMRWRKRFGLPLGLIERANGSARK
jgi:probable rRNA maturation factor